VKRALGPVVWILLSAGCGGPAERAVQREDRKLSVPAAAAPKITQFYASPAAVAPGGKALLCYGVEGATEVRLEPRVEDLLPAMARCIEVTPASTTRYVLRARGADGTEAASEAVVTVAASAPAAGAAPAAEIIRFFTASRTTAAKGEPVTICYGVKGAKSVTLTPPLHPVRTVERECFTTALESTTTLRLDAAGAAGEKDAMTLRIAVE